VLVGTGAAPRPLGIKRTVHLNHVVLEELKKSDPERYAQVRGVMTAASELCGQNAGRLWSAANLQAARCSNMFLRTSYPPKREIGFQIEDTWYVALVTVKEKPPLLVGGPDKLLPVPQTK
jgi:hypothetical protein